jgi:hypothetical protein
MTQSAATAKAARACRVPAARHNIVHSGLSRLLFRPALLFDDIGRPAGRHIKSLADARGGRLVFILFVCQIIILAWKPCASTPTTTVIMNQYNNDNNNSSTAERALQMDPSRNEFAPDGRENLARSLIFHLGICSFHLRAGPRLHARLRSCSGSSPVSAPVLAGGRRADRDRRTWLAGPGGPDEEQIGRIIRDRYRWRAGGRGEPR